MTIQTSKIDRDNGSKKTKFKRPDNLWTVQKLQKTNICIMRLPGKDMREIVYKQDSLK